MTLNKMLTLTVLSVALSAALLASASTSNVALTEEKIQMSKLGTLEYGSLSEQEKLRLFKEFERDCKRKVTLSLDICGLKFASVQQVTCNTLHLTPIVTFYISSSVLINSRAEG